MQETWFQSLGQEDHLVKGMATHISILAWRIPWTQKPDGLHSIRLQRIGLSTYGVYISNVYKCMCVYVCVCINIIYIYVSVQFSSVVQSCPTLCDPMNRSTPGPPVHHQLPELTQTHVHRVGDAIQPSHPP